MPDEYPRRWENIAENTYRLQVPDGWLVKDIYTFVSADKSCSVSTGTWTVIDPHHDKWVLKSK